MSREAQKAQEHNKTEKKIVRIISVESMRAQVRKWNWCEKQIVARRALACHEHAKKLLNYP